MSFSVLVKNYPQSRYLGGGDERWDTLVGGREVAVFQLGEWHFLALHLSCLLTWLLVFTDGCKSQVKYLQVSGKNTHKINSHHQDYNIKMSIYNIAARLYHHRHILYLAIEFFICVPPWSLNCIGWRVKSRSILNRVVAGIAKKNDEFVLI